jgi:hypothetical protein
VAEQFLKYTIIFDKKTGALKQIQDEVGGVETKTGRDLPAAANKAKGAFGSLAQGIKAFAIGALILDAVKSALKGQESFQQLQQAFRNTAQELGTALAPALDKVSTGLRALLAIVAGATGFVRNAVQGLLDFLGAQMDSLVSFLAGIMNAITGDFRGALENMKTAAKEWGGSFKEVVDQDWAASLEKLKASFGTASEIVKARMKETTEASVVGLRTEAEARIAHLEAMRELERAAAEEALADQNATAAEKAGILADETAAELEAEREKFAIRREIMRAEFELDRVLTAEEKAKLAALAQAHEDQVVAIQAAGAAKQRALARDKLAVEADRAKQILGIEQAAGNALLAFVKKAADGQRVTARDLARDLVKTVGEEAAAVIMARYAEGAAKEVATKGLAGLASAAGILAQGIALSAAVAGITGAAAKAIGGGGGGGGGATEPTGGTAGEAAPGAPAGGIPGAPPGTAQPAGPNITINVTGAFAGSSQEIARAIRDAIGGINSL